MKIALVIPDDHSMLLFRSGLIRTLVESGHDVIAVCADTGRMPEIAKLGARPIHVDFGRWARPFDDLRLIAELKRVYMRERPDIVHNFAAKPNVYGTAAAWLARVPRIFNSVTGLGYVWGEECDSVVTSAAKMSLRAMYAIVGRIAERTWFQNPDDLEYFVARGLISRNRCVLIKGSGVNTATWTPVDYPPERRALIRDSLGVSSSAPLVLMVSRALRTKGAGEFFSAAALVARHIPDVKFLLAGPAENDARGLTPFNLRQLESQNVRWLGMREDVRDLTAAADICVLPSYYREGVPRALLEAMAMGKAIVTCDAPGCREAVDAGVNGLLVPPRDVDSLAGAIERILGDRAQCAEMGRQGRLKAEREFEEKLVVRMLLDRLYRV